MASRYYQRPENAISKADEFLQVGKLLLVRHYAKILKLTPFFTQIMRLSDDG